MEEREVKGNKEQCRKGKEKQRLRREVEEGREERVWKSRGKK